ncbi:MAG: hypothetical protein ACKVP7_09380 [Hyphomicrobiaceae bacterium]
MAANRDDDANARAIELLTQLLSHDDLDALLASFTRGEIEKDRIVNELAARYQRGIGSAVQALAEHDKEAAQQLGLRLRDRLNEFLAGLGQRDTPSSQKTAKLNRSESFKDRDDAVLLREFVILKALAKTDAAFKSAEIYALVRQYNPNVQDDAITAHLGRMLKLGVIGKERKGRYSAVPGGAEHLAALSDEIEVRGLPQPTIL